LVNWKIMERYKPKYFSKKELECPCCGKCEMDDNFLLMLDRAREYAGIPFVISSGFRCEKHNREVGGSPTSSHLKGKAVDIVADNSRRRYIILKALMKVGFTRIGIGKNFIHVDNDESKVQGVIWLYNY